MQQTNDPAAIVEVAREPIKLPRENGVRFSPFNAPKHIVEHSSARFFGALALGECFDDRHPLSPRNRVQLGKLGINGEHLAVFVLARFAAIEKVFEHGQSIASDINKCKDKVKDQQITVTTKVYALLRGSSPRERLLHRLHSVVLVLQGQSAREVAKAYNDSPRAVAYWVERFEERDVKGLEEEARPGRPSKLNPSQIKKVQIFIERFNMSNKSVNAQTLSDYIRKHFGIELTNRQCWRILKRFRERIG